MDSDRLSVLPTRGIACTSRSSLAVQVSQFSEELSPRFPKVIRQYTRKKKTTPEALLHTPSPITSVPLEPCENQVIENRKHTSNLDTVVTNNLGQTANIQVKIETSEEIIVKKENVTDTNKNDAKEIEIFDEVVVKKEDNTDSIKKEKQTVIQIVDYELEVKEETSKDNNSAKDTTIKAFQDELVVKKTCGTDTFQDGADDRIYNKTSGGVSSKIVHFEKEVDSEYKMLLSEEFDIKVEMVEDFELDEQNTDETHDVIEFELNDSKVDEMGSKIDETGSKIDETRSKIDVTGSKINKQSSEISVIDGDSNILGSATALANGSYLVKLKKCYLMAVDTPRALSPFDCTVDKEQNYKNAGHRNLNMEPEDGLSLRAHQNIHVKIYKCDICLKTFRYHFELIGHLRLHTQKDFKCDICSKEYKHFGRYGEHLNTHMLEKLFYCPVCQCYFTKKAALQRHVTCHKGNERFTCKFCMKQFTCSIDLNMHASSHSDDFPCNVCGEDFKMQAHLERHKKIHNKILECGFCTKLYPSEISMQEHAIRHIGEIIQRDSQISCKFCNKTFAYQSVLITHERCHTGERPFKCHICKGRFKTRSALNGHVTKHSKPYKCETCGQSFGRNDTLAKHCRLHTGEKPYECNLCDRSFVQRVSLIFHLEKIHGVNKGRCKKKRKVVMKEKRLKR